MKLNFIYTILILAFVISGLELCAQTSTSSPYSMYGIGELKSRGHGQSRGMGGTGIALGSTSSLNNINPASFQGLDSLSFVLEVGFNGRQSYFTTNAAHQINYNFNFDYLAFAFKGANFWASSFGISPYSTVGNNITIKQHVEGSATDLSTFNFSGTGGLNQVYWANSFKAAKNLSLGINLAYIFGTISQIESITNPAYFPGALQEVNKVYMSNATFNLGFQYTFNPSRDVKATVGGIYSRDLIATFDRIFSLNPSLNMRQIIATIDNMGDSIDRNPPIYKSFTFPENFGIGLAIVYQDKLLITADIQRSLWSQSQSLQTNVKFINSTDYNVGIEFQPSKAYTATFPQRIKYRLGGYHSDTYLKIHGVQLFDEGLTTGVGIPLLGHRIFADMAFSIGKRGFPGKASPDFINEFYQTFMFGISLKDFWFVKRQYN